MVAQLGKWFICKNCPLKSSAVWSATPKSGATIEQEDLHGSNPFWWQVSAPFGSSQLTSRPPYLWFRGGQKQAIWEEQTDRLLSAFWPTRLAFLNHGLFPLPSIFCRLQQRFPLENQGESPLQTTEYIGQRFLVSQTGQTTAHFIFQIYYQTPLETTMSIELQLICFSTQLLFED